MAGIINSAQQTGIAAPAAQIPKSTNVDHTQDLERLYGADFNRHSDADGFNFWLGQMNNGATVDQVDQAFHDSPEYKLLHPVQQAQQTPQAPQAPQAPVTTMANAVPSYTPSVTTATPTMATSVGYNAAQQGSAVSSPITQRVVDPSKETVAGQVAGIINQNSPLMQQAQSTALQRANDRGLGNSSIAVGAAQDAVLGAAVPIGTADANVYGNAANLNTTTQNQFTANKDTSQNQINAGNTAAINAASQFGAAASNTASGENAQIGTNVSEFNAGAHNAADTLGVQLAAQKILSDNTLSSQEKNAQVAALTQLNVAQISSNTQRYMTDQNVATQLAVSKMTTTSQQSISQAHDANQTLIANNQQASSAYNNYVVAVANIDNNDKMDEASKRAAIVTQTQIFNAAIIGLRAASPGLSNVTSPIDTTTPVTPAAPVVPTPTIDVSHMMDFGG